MRRSMLTASQGKKKIIVIVGDSYGFYSHDAGVTWTGQSQSTMRSVVYATHLNKFFAVGGKNVYSSVDGTSWQTEHSGLSSDPELDQIVYSPEQSRMIASNLGGSRFRSSTNGTSWPSNTLLNNSAIQNLGMSVLRYQGGSGAFIFTRVDAVDASNRYLAYDSQSNDDFTSAIKHSTNDPIIAVADSPSTNRYAVRGITVYGRTTMYQDSSDGYLSSGQQMIGTDAVSGFDHTLASPQYASKTITYSPELNQFVAIHRNKAIAFGNTSQSVVPSGTSLVSVLWSPTRAKFYAVADTVSYSTNRLYESVDGVSWYGVYGTSQTYERARDVATN